MTTAVIIDIVIVVALVAFALHGSKRGLFQALTGLVVAVVALVGAAILAGTFAGPAARVAAPLVEEHFSEQIEAFLGKKMAEAGLPEETESGMQYSVEDLELEDGFLSDVLGNMEELLADSGRAAVSAAVESVMQTLLYGVLFILAYLGLVLLMRVLLGAMGLLTKLPGISGLNALGGGVLGLVEGALLVFLAVFVLRKLGASFETAALQEAHILRIFTENTPLSVLSFLQ